jgi:phosphoglycerate dehydrogenase-like enzyme
VVLADRIDARAEERLGVAAEIVLPEGIGEQALAEAVRGADAIIVRTSPLSARVIAAGDALRVIGKHGAGLDNIDVAFATAHGVVVVHTPAANATAVAEYTLACMLLLLRGIGQARDALRHGAFDLRRPPVGQIEERGLLGFELAGKRVGIVGWGATGRRVGSVAGALGADVFVYDPKVDDTEIRRSAAIPTQTLDELLAFADVVSLHVSATPETAGLIGSHELALLQPHAILVNASRGSVVDESALVDVLRGNRIRGAAVDDITPEHPPPDHRVLHLDNALCTPHMAGTTVEALRRMGEDVVDAVLAVLAGEIPTGIVNPEVIQTGRQPTMTDSKACSSSGSEEARGAHS